MTYPENKNTVSTSAITMTFNLPPSFGAGWGYNWVFLHSSKHGNFAHEELGRVLKLSGLEGVLSHGSGVDVEIASLEDGLEVKKKIQTVVDAFPRREVGSVYLYGSNYQDAKVSESSFYDRDVDVVASMPLVVYIAKFVPLAKNHPAVDGRDLNLIIEGYEKAQKASSVSATAALTMSDALTEIARLGRTAIDSDGAIHLSEHAVFDAARAGLARQGGEHERAALQAILDLVEPSLADEVVVAEADVLGLAEDALDTSRALNRAPKGPGKR